jgi:hypothetical protein
VSDGGAAPDLAPHLFLDHATGRKRLVFLPRDARVHCGRGQELEAGEVFAHALMQDAPARWMRQNPADRWLSLPELWGSGIVGHLLKLWFDHQALRLARCPGQLLFPAELVSLAAGAAEPLGLWWDFHRSGDLNLVDPQLEAALFPPVPLRRWDRLKFALPGEVAVDAAIADPRFTAFSTDSVGAVRQPGRRRFRRIAAPAKASLLVA